jgi:5-methylcytosine-specific restriction endonuclease McrA
MPKDIPKGACPYCGKFVVYPAGHEKAGQRVPRLKWHPICVKAYRVGKFSEDQRSMLRRNGLPHCFLCGDGQDKRVFRYQRKYRPEFYFTGDHGRYTPVEPMPFEWEADHVVPLWMVPSDVPLNRRACFWGPVNLWALCRKCHAAKTKREAGLRAMLKSGQSKLALEKALVT